MKKFSKKLSIIFTIAIIGVLGFSITASAASTSVPDWVKNNAKWWSEGSITETDYIKSLEYLITQGIIQIPFPITEVTAAQTALSDGERAQSFVVHFSDGMIGTPVTIDTFVKFEATSSQNQESELYSFPIYKFDDQPEFLLESMPSADKQEMYKGIDRWMRNIGSTATPFDVSIDVVSGDGQIILTSTGFGTFLQDVTFYYQFVDQEKSEIRERVTFVCAGAHLVVP